MPEHCIGHAERVYDTGRTCNLIESEGTVPNIPPQRRRRWKICVSRTRYRSRDAIKRMFCRLEDNRRLATRHDRLATNFLGSISLAAAVTL